MAQEVGDLRVRLSLDDAAFGRSITSMNRTLQAMGQEIRGLQNRGKEWGSSIDGLKTKQEAYSRLLEGQQTKVRRLADEYEKAKQQYGEHSTKAEQLAVQLNRAAAEMERTERELSEITAELERQERELAQSQTAWAKLGTALTNAGAKLKAVGDGMKNVGKELSMKVTAPLTALGLGAAKAAIDFESAFAGVRKTVDATEEGFVKLEKGILEMARTLPASASDIAAVAESAGQLGIAEENILSFTRTIIDLGESTNLTAEQGASEFARFANIVGMSQNDFDRLGSSIVGLGNTMATTESEIMSMSMRLAAQGSQVGMTESQILALSATMSSLGIEAEAGGTAMTTVLKKMQNAVSNGGNDLKAFADAAKMSTTDFAKAFKEDAVIALDFLVKGLAKSTEEGANLNDILRDMDIKGIREADTLLRLAGASDLLEQALGTSGKAWEENTALSTEAEQRYATTASQLQMLKNRLVEVGISFGQVLLPFLIQIVETLTPIITKFAEMDGSMQMVILAIAGIAAAIGPVLIVLGMLISSIGTIATVLGAISAPIAIAVGVIALIGIALATAYAKSESFREKINQIFMSVKDVFVDVFNAIYTFVVEQITKIKQFWDENGAQIVEATENAFNIIKGIIDFIMPAILFVIDYVWTAIKTVISGALDVIMGVVKIFSGLFTGDFSKMWEGVKQLFFGAIDAILGVLSLTFLGGIRTIFMNLSKTAINLIKTKWTTIASSFKSFATSLPTTVSGMVRAIIDFFKNLGTTAVSTVKTMATGLINAVLALPAQFLGIGKNIIQGLINGIKSLDVIKVMSGVIGGVVNAAKSLLGINSPSLVMQQIGEWTGEGFANGMDNSLNVVQKAAKGLAEMTTASVETQVTLDNKNQQSMMNGLAETIAMSNQPLDLSGLNNLVGQIINRPVELLVNLDGQTIARTVSTNQYNNAALTALTKGVSLG